MARPKNIVNLTAVEIKAKKDPKTGHPLDGIPFHPYYSVHDLLGVTVFLMVFTAIIFFAPEFGGYFLEYNNFIPADPLKTPPHIAPVWYFTPFYSILRAVTYPLFGIDAKLPGMLIATVAAAPVTGGKLAGGDDKAADAAAPIEGKGAADTKPAETPAADATAPGVEPIKPPQADKQQAATKPRPMLTKVVG